MPYARLPVAKFKALYPQFSTLTEAQYDAWAEKIEPKVSDRFGDNWQDATELFLAHTLAINGVGTGAAGGMALNGATSFDSGDFKIQLSNDIVSARAKGGLKATIYGQQFLALKRDIGGPRLVGFIDPGCC